MIICPNCQHQEMTGAIYCSQCGGQLVDLSHLAPQTPNRDAFQQGPFRVESIPAPEEMRQNPRISLKLVESGQILVLADQPEFTLGRSNKDQPIIPDVDLTQYHAFESGISRLHAVLKLTEGKIELMDLGSSNGTFLGGERLAPYLVTPVANGDIIHLGRMKIQILIE